MVNFDETIVKIEHDHISWRTDQNGIDYNVYITNKNELVLILFVPAKITKLDDLGHISREANLQAEVKEIKIDN